MRATGGPLSRARLASESALPAAIAAVLAVAAINAPRSGSDLAAHVFRVELFKRSGFVLWNAQWFGGHPTLTYSVISPVVAAVVGPLPLIAMSSVGAAALFDRLAREHFGRAGRVASIWFAVGTVANVVVGRVPFALGLALGLAAVLALCRRRPVLATVAAIAAGLASPVAGVFVAIAAGGWAGTAGPRRWISVPVAAGALAPIVVTGVAFPGGGTFPYASWAFAWDVGLAAACFVAAGRERRALRVGAGIFACAAVATFAVPNPLGGNLSRLSQFFAAPLLVCCLWERRRALVALFVVPLLCWQWLPAVEGMAAAHRDPSTTGTYYQPLLSVLAARHDLPGRLEIPSTLRHWESAYVAPTFPLARGWERQLDRSYDHVFYDDTLDALTYRQWLDDNAVEYVALPDAPLDASSEGERLLLRSRLAYLRPLWHDRHWQLWRYTGYRGMVDGAAVVIDRSPDSFTLRVDAPGSIILKVRSSSHWAVEGAGCVEPDGRGWTRLSGLHPGIVRISQRWVGTPCP